MKKALVVNRELGLNTVSDLIDNWNNLKILYQESIGNFLYGFEQKALDKTQSFESEADVLKYFLYKYQILVGVNIVAIMGQKRF